MRHVMKTRRSEELCVNVVPLHLIDLAHFKSEHGEDWLQVIQEYGAVYSIRKIDMIQSVGPQMAIRTESADKVAVESWSMPMGEGKRIRRIHTLLVESTGEAERFGRDPLMKEFALRFQAKRSRRAHAFHFFKESDATEFCTALRDTIECVNLFDI